VSPARARIGSGGSNTVAPTAAPADGLVGSSLGGVLERIEEHVHSVERTVAEARLRLMDQLHVLEKMVTADPDTLLLRIRRADAPLTARERMRAVQALDHAVDRLDATVGGVVQELRADTDQLVVRSWSLSLCGSVSHQVVQNVLRRVRELVYPSDMPPDPPPARRRAYSPGMRRRSRSVNSQQSTPEYEWEIFLGGKSAQLIECREKNSSVEYMYQQRQMISVLFQLISTRFHTLLPSLAHMRKTPQLGAAGAVP
jgi:hypothetical protein